MPGLGKVLAVALLASGCAGIPITREVMGGNLAWDGAERPPAEIPTEPAGECTPTLLVRVLDASGRLVPGVQVVSQQRVFYHQGEDPIIVHLYRSAPVLTDGKGVVRACNPSAVYPAHDLQGVGGGTTTADPGTLTVEIDGHQRVLKPPFAEDVLVILEDL